VAVSGDANSSEVIDRRRIVIIDASIPGAKQPYHYAAELLANPGLSDSEKHLAKCAASSERLALTAVQELVRELEVRHLRVAGAAVLLASGRPLPSLSKILASHALIHTADGEFFRDAARKACETLGISVFAMREREIDKQAATAFGNAASRVQSRISSLGRSIGPPWTKDHKSAALAACVILAATPARLDLHGPEASPASSE